MLFQHKPDREPREVPLVPSGRARSSSPQWLFFLFFFPPLMLTFFRLLRKALRNHFVLSAKQKKKRIRRKKRDSDWGVKLIAEVMFSLRCAEARQPTSSVPHTFLLTGFNCVKTQERTTPHTPDNTANECDEKTTTVVCLKCQQLASQLSLIAIAWLLSWKMQSPLLLHELKRTHVSESHCEFVQWVIEKQRTFTNASRDPKQKCYRTLRTIRRS